MHIKSSWLEPMDGVLEGYCRISQTQCRSKGQRREESGLRLETPEKEDPGKLLRWAVPVGRTQNPEVALWVSLAVGTWPCLQSFLA